MPQKNPGLLGRGQRGLTTPDDRQKALEILEEAIATGARTSELRHQFAGDGEGVDGCKGSSRQVVHRLSEEERRRILLTCNEPNTPHCRQAKSCLIWVIAPLCRSSSHESC